MSESPTSSKALACLEASARAAPPLAAIVLGSGMSPIAQRLSKVESVRFAEIPGLPTTTVVGHAGCLLLGEWSGVRTLVFCGRLHLYEGHPARNVVQSAHMARYLGARVYLLTNAAGGIHPALGPGTLMAIKDHIDWTRPNAWRSPGPGGLGPGRPSPYSAKLRSLLQQAAIELGMQLPEGVYAQVTGPCYETPAEIRALRSCGADAVGMSTAREAQAAFDLGLECAGVSLITNQAAGLSAGPIRHHEVVASAADYGEFMAALIERFLVVLQTTCRESAV